MNSRFSFTTLCSRLLCIRTNLFLRLPLLAREIAANHTVVAITLNIHLDTANEVVDVLFYELSDRWRA